MRRGFCGDVDGAGSGLGFGSAPPAGEVVVVVVLERDFRREVKKVRGVGRVVGCCCSCSCWWTEVEFWRRHCWRFGEVGEVT